jgi:hypothetical protein
MHPPGRLRVGLVGPARTRQGLGPFLARHVEAAGGQVVAVAGREPERTRAAAAALAAALGHPVAAEGSLADLLERHALDALVVAAPPAAHEPALELALAARVPVLCEKPLLLPGRAARAAELIDAFLAAGLPLIENCQWPFVLHAFERLFAWPGALRPQFVAQRLSPVGSGRAMVEDSLSHFVSLVQAVAATPLPRLQRIQYSPAEGVDAVALEVEFASDRARVTGRLELVREPAPPRSAWIQLDGRRAERRIELPSYRMSLCAEGRTVELADPTQALVYRFADLVRRRPDDVLRREARVLTERAAHYDAVLAAWPAD